MEHSFDINIAKGYGIEEAILLKNIYGWIMKNKANNKHFYNNRYWTYNSARAFAELFPYMSARSISRKLTELQSKGIIMIDNFNDNKYDRTQWYALTDKGLELFNGVIVQEKEEPKEKEFDTNKINTVIELYKQTCKSFNELKTLSNKRKTAISARLKSYTLDDFKTVFTNAEDSDFLKGNNNKNWKADFDWMMKDDNFAKILEGNYNKNKAKASAKYEPDEHGMYSAF